MKSLLAVLSITILGFAGIARAEDGSTVKSYQLENCIYDSGKVVPSGKGVTVIYKGQTMAFCSDDCKAKFKKDPEAGLEKYKAMLTSFGGRGKDH